MEHSFGGIADAYRRLIEDFTRLVGLERQPGSIHQPGNFIFDGVALTIALNSREGDQVHVYVDFGACPTDDALPVFKRLLEVNLLLGSMGSPRLALDPLTERVVFTYSSDLQSLTAPVLLAGIERAVGQANEWRKNFFFDVIPPVPAECGFVDLRHALHV